MADQVEDVREIVHPRPPQAEARIYPQPRWAPDIGQQALDLGILCNPPCCGPTLTAALLPTRLDDSVYDEYYGAALGHRLPTRPGQHCLAKLDVFKGENGDRLDDFIYDVEEFAVFHTWDPVESCRRSRTHPRWVSLTYVQGTPLPPRNWRFTSAIDPAKRPDHCIPGRGTEVKTSMPT